MEGEKLLYEYLYQSVLTQIYSGAYRFGQRLPSQQELCRRYNVGITTVRKAVRMLEQDGFIETADRKRPTVTYQADMQACMAVLKQRKSVILDIYKGMGYLMPRLHTLGAMQYQNYQTLQEIIDGVREDMEQRELFVQGSRFFLQLLTPYNNKVLNDLQTDSQNYTIIPYLPVSGPKDGYSITPGQVKSGLSSLLEVIRTKNEVELLRLLQQIFVRGWERTKRYLEALEECSSGGEEYNYRWVMGKNRAHLYTVIARRLQRRILDGEFQGRKYIPSVPELMKEYVISQATALSAIALLNDINLVRTLDKKGTVIIKSGEKPASIRMDWPVISENLFLFLDALQILTVCSRDFAYIVLSGMEHEEHRKALEQWDRENPQDSGTAIRFLLRIFRDNAPCACLKSFFEQMDDLLIWGHYLKRDPAYAKRDDQTVTYLAALRLALLKKDTPSFSECVHEVFILSYRSVWQQMISYGLDQEKLPAQLSKTGIER